MTKADLFTWYFDQKAKLGTMFADGKITKPEYNQMVDKLDKQLNDASDLIDQGKEPKLTNVKAPASSGTSGTMTPEEYKAAKSAMYQKYKNGEITNYAYIQWKKKNDPALNAQNGAVSAALAKSGTSAGTVGGAADPGQKAADDAVLKLEKELNKVYGSAAKDMQAKLKEFTDEYFDELVEKQQKVASGEMTQAELQEWVDHKGEMIDVMKQKIDVCTGVMLNANKKAMAMVNGETFNVFAENANYQSYQLCQDTKMDLMFSVYDENTVENLIKNKPELIPRKKVNVVKDQAWNQKKIANAVTQSIIRGESIPDLAKRIAAQTASDNDKAMLRYARTAMTSAQNNGRLEMLHRAKGMGIEVKKVWLATLDSRTRDSHQAMDGVKADVDEDFKTPLGSKMKCPGDMAGKPGDVWNCRCTLIYDYEGFPNDPTLDERLMYDEYYTTEKDADGNEVQVYHRESRLITDMSYDEWKAAKQGSKLNDLNAAKSELAELQKQVIQKGINENKVYSNLWKDDVTLADYPSKKAGIQAKRDYYDAEIEKYKQAQASGASWATDEKIQELEKKRKLLNEFEKNGQLIAKRNAALKNVQDIYDKIGYQKTAAAPLMSGKAAEAPKAGGKINPFMPDAYSQERKDKALWTTNKKKVDGELRPHTGEVWQNATPEERDAIFEYTQSYHKYNEPLRGQTYGTSAYVGVGNTDLNASYANNGKRLNAMTDIIDGCSYDEDIWMQRGCRFGGMDKFFQCDMDLLRYGSQSELERALVGKTVTEYGFMSMGSAKGNGFTGDIMLNVYCPKGTKMMYAEPFSYYGHDKNGRMNGSNGLKWDGKSTQPSYGTEFETIMQQGTQFRVTKVDKSKGKIWVDIEVINQDNQQRWKP